MATKRTTLVESQIKAAVKLACDGAASEIVAGGSMFPITDAERAFNHANIRAQSILRGYAKGEGLFQLTAKLKAGPRATRREDGRR